MSRSRKKTPVNAHTCAESEKTWKRQANRRLRRINNMIVDKVLTEEEEEEEIFKIMNEVSEIWDGPKDGKSWFGNGLRKHPWLAKYMRK